MARQARSELELRAFPMYAETTLEPSIVVVVAGEFDHSGIRSLLEFAEKRDLALSIGGAGVKFSQATMKERDG